MKYWSYPPQGTGSESYTSRTRRFQLSADFNHPYYWDLMLDSYGFSASEEQKNAVAQLCYDLGVAFHMDYDPSGSGAYTTDAVQIMPKFFYYSNQISSESYPGNDQDWFNRFKEEIDNGRPALMSIRGDAGGHAVVCDGYRTDQGNMIHLNFGWGGTGNTYFAINNIVVAGNDFKWVEGQEIVKKIMPTETQPLACYSAASPMGGKAPVTVSFAGQGKRGVAPYTYAWDFGDGTTGTGQFPSHIYSNPGSYTVTLTTTDSLGQTSQDNHLKINVTSSTGLSATAQASTTSGKVPLSVDFTAVAQGGVPSYTYIWNFGDGSSETTTNATITHIYTTPGTYTASLTVKDSINSQTTAPSITITAQPSGPVPQISSVSKLSSPFRLKVLGSNFISSSVIKIDGNAIPQTIYKNGTTLVGKGGTALKNMCPKGVPVKITVENEAGNVSNEYMFTR
ncbi:MAG: C10 family peptidase [Acidobacteria bacterium]|nr:C10 family peptidase [Acidobacteriota bacterium]